MDVDKTNGHPLFGEAYWKKKKILTPFKYFFDSYAGITFFVVAMAIALCFKLL